MKKFLCLFLPFLIFSVAKLSAQAYGCYYFIKAGTELTESSKVTIVLFSGNELGYLTESAAVVSSKLSQNSSYWEDALRREISRRKSDKSQIQYDPGLSTSKYSVYKGDTFGQQRYVQTGPFSWEWVQNKDGGHHFYALSSDKNELIKWYESKGSNIPKDKVYYERVNENTFKVGSHDFLN